MTFEVKEPVLVVGLGGAGIKLASEIKGILGADSLKISQDKKPSWKRDITNEK